MLGPACQQIPPGTDDSLTLDVEVLRGRSGSTLPRPTPSNAKPFRTAFYREPFLPLLVRWYQSTPYPSARFVKWGYLRSKMGCSLSRLAEEPLLLQSNLNTYIRAYIHTCRKTKDNNEIKEKNHPFYVFVMCDGPSSPSSPSLFASCDVRPLRRRHMSSPFYGHHAKKGGRADRTTTLKRRSSYFAREARFLFSLEQRRVYLCRSIVFVSAKGLCKGVVLVRTSPSEGKFLCFVVARSV